MSEKSPEKINQRVWPEAQDEVKEGQKAETSERGPITDAQIKELTANRAVKLASLLPEKSTALEDLYLVRKIPQYEELQWLIIYRGSKTGNLYKEEIESRHAIG